MRILNIMQCTNLGGMEQASLRLMRELCARGHEVHVVSLNPLGDLAPLLAQAGISAEGLPYRGIGGWASMRLVRQRMMEYDANALLMTGHHLLTSVMLPTSRWSRAVLCIHHYHTAVKAAWQWRLIYRLAQLRFSAITFPSDFIRREAERLCPSIASISQTVRNPLPIPDLPGPDERLRARRSFGIEPDVPIIGNAGWLTKRKRFDVFLTVAAQLLRQGPATRFLIAGGGPERANLEAHARQLGLAHCVTWLGWQKDLRSFYSAIDVFLFNSEWDAFPTSPLEAMSFGIPVVASVRRGGLAEVITSDDVGFLRTEHNVDELASLVMRLIANRSLRAVVGTAGRKRVAEVCSFRKCVDAYEQLLSPLNQGAYCA